MLALRQNEEGFWLDLVGLLNASVHIGFPGSPSVKRALELELAAQPGYIATRAELQKLREAMGDEVKNGLV